MKRLALSLVLASSLLLPAALSAKQLDINACMTQVQNAMGARQRFYRAVVFGEPAAKDSPQGSVRYDKDGDPWIKKADNAWQFSNDKGSTTQSDDNIDKTSEFPPRIGWLEVKKATTSELLPPVLQSMRALQCKMAQVCPLLLDSLGTEKTDQINVHIAGCSDEKLTPFSACQPEDPTTDQPSYTQQDGLEEQCESLASTILNRERGLLRLMIAYDAAERTLYQFMGISGTFISELKTTLLGPVWQAARAFEQLGRIPCFTAQCEP